MSKLTKSIVDKLIKDFHLRPRDFYFEYPYLHDRETGCRFQIDGWMHFCFSHGVSHPVECSFGFYQSLRFHRALAKLKVRILEDRLIRV